LRAVRPDISAGVEDIVLKALAREPQDRFPGIQAFSDALEQASQTTEAGAFHPAHVPQRTPLPRQKERPLLPAKPVRRAFLVGGLAAGLATAAGTLIWQMNRIHSGPPLVTGGNTTQKPDATKMDAVVTGVAWSPGGRLYASTDGSGHVRVWDINQQLQWQHNLGIKIWSLSWSPDSLGAQRLAVAGDDGKVRIFDALSGEQTLLYAGHSQAKVLSVTWPLPVVYSPFTNVFSILNLVASGDINGTIQVWNPDTGEVRRTMTQAAPVTGLAFGNAFVASVGTPPGGMWSVWSLERPQDVHYLNNTENFINTSSVSTGGAPITSAKAATMTAVGWSKDMHYLCIGDSGGHLLVAEMGQQWRWPCYFLGAKGQINAVCWSTITNECATASDDGTVHIWKFPAILNYAVKVELSPEKTWTPGGRIKSLAWSPDGKYLLAGNETGQLAFLQV
jgi:eukaryotic-like serine/threonine-protein kinase